MSYPAHHPDGLTEEVIDGLLAEADAAVVPLRRPTSPFALQELDVRRDRRRVNRQLAQLAHVGRVLPLVLPVLVVRGRAA